MYIITNLFLILLAVIFLRETFYSKTTKAKALNTMLLTLSVLSFIYTINSNWRL
jgi:uncharacterized protein involved in response to NO